MRKLDHDEERQKIAAVAARLIAHKGVQHLTTNDIAEDMGATRGKVLHYFDNANHIIEAAFEWANRLAEKRLTDLSEGVDIIEITPEIINQLLPLTEETDIEWKVRLSCWESAFTDEKQRAFQVKQAHAHLEGITAVIAIAQKEKTIRDDIPAEDLAKVVSDMTRGLALVLLNLPLEERKDRTSSVHALIKLFQAN